MQTKGLLILLILVVLTGGYILVFERTAEEAAAYHALDARAIRFSPESLSSLRVTKGELEFECVSSDEQWTLAYPVMARVSVAQFDRLVTGLSGLKRRDTVAVAGADDLNQYGFDAPRARLKISDNQGIKTWLVGRDAPLGKMVYVMEEGGSEVVVTDATVLTMLPSNIEDIRDRSIFPPTMASVNRIDIRRSTGFLQLGADAGGAWRLQQPVVSAADNGAVGKLLDDVLATRIEKFVADEVTDMASYGLQDPQVQIMLASGEETGVGLLIGNPVPDQDGLVYAKQTEEYAIFAVSTKILKRLQIHANDLRDRRLLPMPVERVQHISVQQEGNGTLTLNQTGENAWELTEPRRWRADPRKITMFLNIWNTAKADKFVALDETVADPRGALAITLTFTGATDDESYVLKLYQPKTEGGAVLCSREGESLLFSVNPELLRIAMLKALDFKDRGVIALQPKDVTKITQDFSKKTVVLSLNESGEFADAVPEKLSAMWSVLKGLQAQVYVEESPESLTEYGLDTPRCRLTLSLKDSNEIGRVLLIGGTCKIGRYALLQGTDIVFIMNSADADVLCDNLKSTAKKKADEH